MIYCEMCGYHPAFNEDPKYVLKFHIANKDEGIFHCETCCDEYERCDDRKLIPFDYGRESIEEDKPNEYR